ncbi:MAG TPA: hypothetical protein VFL75_03415 [Candidatus Limnocylindria bacterium]|jgi:hypothetical protein|nr:hypothetical protein [Candidatus Limnocylindria bacterium]
MTRRPFDRGDPDDLGPDLDATLADLERYAADSADYPTPAFVDRVMEAVDQQPTPRRGVIAAWLASVTAPGSLGRLALLAATAAVAILAVVALGQLGNLLPPPNLANSPQPTRIVSPSPEPSPSLTPSPTPRETNSPRASESASESSHASDGADTGDSVQPSDHHDGADGDGEDAGPTSSED